MQYHQKRKTLLTTVLLYFPIFMAMYAIPFIIDRDLFPSLNQNWLDFPTERWLVWVVPSVILIKIFQKDIFVSLKDMFFNKVKLKTLLWCWGPIILYLVGGLFVTKFTGFTLGGQLRNFSNTNEFFHELLNSFWGVLVVPAIPEEMVFRAWILNAFLGKSPSKRKTILSIVISSILFVIMHLPTFFYLNYSILHILLSGLMVFAVGSAFGIMFYKSKNILVSIFAHWLWDVFTMTFYL